MAYGVVELIVLFFFWHIHGGWERRWFTDHRLHLDTGYTIVDGYTGIKWDRYTVFGITHKRASTGRVRHTWNAGAATRIPGNLVVINDIGGTHVLEMASTPVSVWG